MAETNLGAPDAGSLTRGSCELVRIYPINNAAFPTVGVVTAGVARAVAPIVIEGVESFNIGEPSPDFTVKAYQKGGGLKYRQKKLGYVTTIEMSFVNSGFLKGELAELLNWGTWSKTGNTFIPFVPDDNEIPICHIEGIYREDDNKTHMFSRVALDVVWNPMSFSSGLDEDTFTLTGYTQVPPGLIPDECGLFYDEFQGDDTETDFILSETALDLFDESKYHAFYSGNLLSVKEKAVGDDEGTEQTSGWSHAAGTATKSTAPASGTVVQIAYIAEM